LRRHAVRSDTWYVNSPPKPSDELNAGKMPKGVRTMPEHACAPSRVC
jgi:hypothetical protein